MNSPNAKKNSNSNNGPFRIEEILRSGAERLRRAGVDGPRFNAEKIIAHILGCDRAMLIARANDTVPSELSNRMEQDIARRESRQPLQHIIGETEFWSLPIHCDRRALIPRPDTEILVKTALDFLRSIPAPRVAEIGTGTGCISISIARERPDAHVMAVDIDPGALELAESNVTRHNLTRQVELIQGDLAGPLLARGLSGRFDLILSNPPYVNTAQLEQLEPEVREHDPRLALDGGKDGLDIIKRLLNETAPLLKDSGLLAMEIGAGQANAVRDLVRANNVWSEPRTVLDANGIERVIIARKEKTACNPSKLKAEPHSGETSA